MPSSSMSPAASRGSRRGSCWDGSEKPQETGRQTQLLGEQTCPLESDWQRPSSVLHRCCTFTE